MLELELKQTGIADAMQELDVKEGFPPAYQRRATVLVGLLLIQSLSSFILASQESMLSRHPILVWVSPGVRVLQVASEQHDPFAGNF